MKTSSSKSRGQALAEFALVAPLFFLLLFGIIEAGRFVFYTEVLNNATREGARYAIVHSQQTFGDSTGPAQPPAVSDDPAGDDVVARVREAATGMVGTAIAVDRCWWPGDVTNPCDFSTHGPGYNTYGYTVTVQATYTYSALIPLVPLPNITVSAESSLVITN